MPASGEPVRDRQLQDLQYWLRNAPDINENNPDSAANQYIRAITSAGLRWDGYDDRAQPSRLQNTSDTIGANVIGDVLRAQGIPTLEQLVGRDIAQALGGNKQTLAGWGGSAYYWNLPYTDTNGVTKTVGDWISQRPDELEKFVSVNAAAIRQIAPHFNFSPYQTMLSLAAGTQAALPDGLKAAIFNRVLDVTAEGANIAGDPENIDGYKPVYGGPYDAVVGWRQSLGDGRFQTVADPALIQQLSQRRQIRLDKGADTSWANSPETGAAPADDGTGGYRKGGWNGPNSQPGQWPSGGAQPTSPSFGSFDNGRYNPYTVTLPATPASGNSPYAYVSVPSAMPKNALAICAQQAQASPSFRNALIAQTAGDTAADTPDAGALDAMALMRAFGLPPLGIQQP